MCASCLLNSEPVNTFPFPTPFFFLGGGILSIFYKSILLRHLNCTFLSLEPMPFFSSGPISKKKNHIIHSKEDKSWARLGSLVMGSFAFSLCQGVCLPLVEGRKNMPCHSPGSPRLKHQSRMCSGSGIERADL